jgi:hypothetical protein
MIDLSGSIRERYLAVLERLASAAARAGRDPRAVKLVVVTKSQPLQVVKAALQAGVRVLGENYPEEGATKIQSLRDFSGVEWHMIGHVQSRKAGIVARHFNYLHSLDGSKLAGRLSRSCGEAGVVLPTLLEFNVGGEESKFGWPAWDEARWPELLREIAAIASLPHLQIRGLMAMPPIGEDPGFSRPFFQRLRRLQEYLAGQFPQLDLGELSMGTSLDYEVAVEEGATMVRVGSAILGPRPYRQEA